MRCRLTADPQKLFKSHYMYVPPGLPMVNSLSICSPGFFTIDAPGEFNRSLLENDFGHIGIMTFSTCMRRSRAVN
jgi:hypothetical protein